MSVTQEQQIEILKELAYRKLEEEHKEQRDSLYSFLKYYRETEKKQTLDHNRHLELICDKLEKVFSGEIKRLIINVPPRSLKTEIVSIAFPAWCIGKRHGMKFMDISYSATLAEQNSGQCRNMYQSQTYGAVFPRSPRLKDDLNTKKHWENLDGGQYYASGSTGAITGLGADCLTGDTEILTNKGIITIKEIFDRKDCNIVPYSYNHTSGQIELQKILAYRKIQKDAIYTITTSEGDKIRCTGNHRIFILGQGYTKAQDIKHGMKMNKANALQKMLKDNEMKVNTLQRMLLGDEKDCYNDCLGGVLKGSGKKTFRYKEIIKKMIGYSLLFKKMSLTGLYQKVCEKMYILLNKTKAEQKHKVLFGGVQEGTTSKEQETKEYRVYILQNSFSPTLKIHKILLHGMQKFSSLTEYPRHAKSKLLAWAMKYLPKRVLGNKECSDKERPMKMCGLLNRGDVACPSQRQQSLQQHIPEFNNSLQNTSGASSFEAVTIERIDIEYGNFTVYDIQVEQNTNFFANGYLVHNCLIIDDPLKPDDAMSDVVRVGVNNNFHQTLKSRLNSKQDGAIVIIMQRLHDDDLCGHLMDLETKGGEKRDKLIIKAIAEEDDNHRKQGESFFEKRFPLNILKQMKNDDSQGFSSQMQQEPTNKEAQEFHEERYKYHGTESSPTPSGLRIFTAVDPAFKTGQENDQSAIITGGFKGSELYILEITAGRFTPDILQDKIIYHIGKRQPEKVGIEAFQAQSMIHTFLKQELQRRGMFVSLEEITQSGDKLSKIRKLIPLYRNGLIYHQYGMDELELEEKRFPRGKHDDIVDCLQMLYNLYELQPNSTPYNNINFNISWDQYGRPVYQ